MKRDDYSDQSRPAAEHELQPLFQRTAPDLAPVDVDALFAASGGKQRAKPTPAFVTWREAVRALAKAALGVETASSKRLARSTIMRARIAAVALLAGSVSVLLLILGQPHTNSLFASVQEKLKEVRTVTFDMTTRWGDEPARVVTHHMLLGNDLLRSDELQSGEFAVFDRKQRKAITVSPRERKAVIWSNVVEPDAPYPNLFNMLLAIPERSVERLGRRELDGKKVQGFVLEVGERRLDVWVDPTTKLPVQIVKRDELKGNVTRRDPPGTFEAGTVIENVFTNFVYNSKLDPAQFRIEPPEGYTVERREAPTAEELKEEARRKAEELREQHRRQQQQNDQ